MKKTKPIVVRAHEGSLVSCKRLIFQRVLALIELQLITSSYIFVVSAQERDRKSPQVNLVRRVNAKKALHKRQLPPADDFPPLLARDYINNILEIIRKGSLSWEREINYV